MNTTSFTSAAVELSEKSIDYIVKNSQNGSSAEDNIKSAIALTLAHVENKLNAKKSTKNVIQSAFAGPRKLIGRIDFARSVGKDTLRKMTHGHPESLNWVNSRGRITVVGIFRPKNTFSSYDKFTDITDRIVSGSEELQSADFVRFYTTGFNGKQYQGELTADLLNEDPIAAAQMVRKECRRHAVKEYNARNNDIATRMSDLEKEYEAKLKKLKKESTENGYAKNIKPASKERPKRPAKPITA